MTVARDQPINLLAQSQKSNRKDTMTPAERHAKNEQFQEERKQYANRLLKKADDVKQG